MTKEYALYKGDELLGIGTLETLSKEFGIKIKSLLFMDKLYDLIQAGLVEKVEDK